jgi:hypothetical protein
MPQVKFNLVAVLALIVVVTACESTPPKILSEPGVTRLNEAQTRAHITGNTEKWIEGTGYYNPDGEMEMIWHKIKHKGTWEVSDDGSVCIKVEDWKPMCHYYVDHNGAITMIAEGEGKLFSKGRNRGVNEIIKGKKLPFR